MSFKGSRPDAGRHAKTQSFDCPCGRTVRGNGGISSHRRACHTYKVNQYVHLGHLLATDRWAGMPHFTTWYQNQFEHLRVELRGGTP